MFDKDSLNRSSIIEIMKENNFPKERIDHSVNVADLALEISTLIIADGEYVDKNVVEKGCLLHDIGYLRCGGELIEIPGWEQFGIKIPSDDINHPITGALIVKEWGFSDKIADCVLRHNIGGFTIEECKLLKVNPIPEKDCTPTTVEEKIVHYADLLMLLKRLKLNPLKDPQAIAKAVFPWLNFYFKVRANKEIEINHPTIQREVNLHNKFKKYLKLGEIL
jgi:putative nucleotidyltransferase with HDIG domain